MSRSASVLVIDDDPGTRETLSDMLGLRGYAVETAPSGKAAIAKLRVGHFDVAILDITLPDVSGVDILQDMRVIAPGTEIIFITGYASLTTAIKAIDDAAFAYLIKPFEMDHLVATVQKAVEKQAVSRSLRESEERYRLITETINDGVLLVDPEGRLLHLNRRGEELIGYRLEEFQGRPVFPLLAPGGAQEAQARLEAVRAGQQVSSFFETRILRKDGSSVWVEANLTGMTRAGQVVGILLVARDITERRRLQENLIQAEKLATLGELIGGIAHELNNPLSVMLGHAQLLRMSQHDPSTDARLEKLVDAAQRATRVVRNFLTFARRHRPEKVSVSVNDIIAGTLDLLDYQLRVGDIHVLPDLTPELPVVAGDPYQLQQVVLNLVNNACQAMAAAHGRGTLRVSSAAAPDRSTVTITVADDGPGISPEHLPRIFDAFFTTKPPEEGTGLGLPIARGIVVEHGGTITVESARGRGATFVVTLPVSEVPVVGQAPAERAAVPKGLRILVVEDEAPLRDLLWDALTALGNRVETVSNGHEALEILDRSAMDVLVLDIRMPGMSGTDLWTEVNRRDPALARRVVFCSGDVVGGQVKAFLDSTGCAFVSKPFELSQFLDTLARTASR